MLLRDSPRNVTAVQTGERGEGFRTEQLPRVHPVGLHSWDICCLGEITTTPKVDRKHGICLRCRRPSRRRSTPLWSRERAWLRRGGLRGSPIERFDDGHEDVILDAL